MAMCLGKCVDYWKRSESGMENAGGKENLEENNCIEKGRRTEAKRRKER